MLFSVPPCVYASVTFAFTLYGYGPCVHCAVYAVCVDEHTVDRIFAKPLSTLWHWLCENPSSVSWHEYASHNHIHSRGENKLLQQTHITHYTHRERKREREREKDRGKVFVADGRMIMMRCRSHCKSHRHPQNQHEIVANGKLCVCSAHASRPSCDTETEFQRRRRYKNKIPIQIWCEIKGSAKENSIIRWMMNVFLSFVPFDNISSNRIIFHISCLPFHFVCPSRMELHSIANELKANGRTERNRGNGHTCYAHFKRR